MTKKSILDSAVKIFAKKGFELASMDDIAKQAGVAKGTLYYHFESKDDILYAIIERGIDGFTSILEKKVAVYDDPVEKLNAAIECQLDYFYKYKDFCRILLTEIWRFQIKWKKHIEQIQKKYLAVIEAIIVDGIKSGQFDASLDTEATTAATFGLISFASLDWAIFHSKQPKEKMLTTLRHIFLNGLTTK